MKQYRHSMKINVFYKNTNRLIGTIKRRSTHERQFGNHGAFEVSIGGKRYWGVGNDLYLPSTVIKYLINKGQISLYKY